MRRREEGFTLLELLASMSIGAVFMLGLVATLSTYQRLTMRHDHRASQDDTLRLGLGLVGDAMRNAGYGVPDNDLTTWITWVGGFVTNPTIIDGAGAPDTIHAAACYALPVATLNANALALATDLSVTAPDAGALVAGDLIQVGFEEPAHVVTFDGSTISLDTDPGLIGSQGVQRAYPANATVCRVDVLTFTIEIDGGTGEPYLAMDDNRGSGPQPIVESISDLQVETLLAGIRYGVTLDSSSPPDPVTGQDATRSLRTIVAMRNG